MQRAADGVQTRTPATPGQLRLQERRRPARCPVAMRLRVVLLQQSAQHRFPRRIQPPHRSRVPAFVDTVYPLAAIRSCPVADTGLRAA
jgi:hypothetical protein